MKEILFKAKRKDWRNIPKEEWWVEGYYVKYQPCASISEYVHGIVPADASALYMIEIDPTIICRYTGITDKNDKKIWENDIISHDLAKAIGSVKWYEKDYVGWCVDEIYDDAQQFDVDMLKECEVIGNIFDNSDLLEVER